MEKLIVSTGLKRYEVNDSGAIFSFNPTDINLYARFLRMRDTVTKIGEEVEEARKRIDIDTENGTKEYALLLEEADRKAKEALTECFSVNNDFNAIFDGANAFSPTDTGQWIITNFIMAITPVVEKEVTAFTKEKAKRQAAKAKQSRAKRAKK